MQVKPAGNIPFTEKEWNDFKERLANTLREKAYTTDVIFNDVELRNFIINFMESEIANEKKDTERLILGTNIRLAHMELETANGVQVFPIINTYKGHHLMYTEYFYKDETTHECKLGRVEVVPKIILV